MSSTHLLSLLADGRFHSGRELAEALGVSRTAVWKQLNKMAERGLQVEAVKGKGYRIADGIDLLDEASVGKYLSSAAAMSLNQLVLLDRVDSTSAEVQRHAKAGDASGLVCTAEQQTAGRGRRGREWISPYACNLYVSVGWSYEQGAAVLEGLSLAVGVAVANALTNCGLPPVQLKWPNDVLFDGAKLGGVLLEMSGDAAGRCLVVVGVGLNVAMPADAARAIDQTWTDVRTIAEGRTPGRNRLLAALLNELLPLLAGYGDTGFAPWRDRWQGLDAYAGKTVVLAAGERRVAGVAEGVDERGALQLRTTGGVQSVYGGEISLRPAL